MAPAPLRAVLVTLGDPGKLTGGYLYHQRMARAAADHGARLDFVSFPELPFPLATVYAPRVLARARRLGAQALVVDSIAAAFVGPWLAGAAPGLPLLGMLHQAPGGYDHGRLRTSVQAALDRLAYRRARLLMVASEWLRDELAAHGVPRSRLRVVPPGRDVPGDGPEPLLDLRQGRRAAMLCVANWVPNKGLHLLLEALAQLPTDLATLHLVGDDGAHPGYTAHLRRRMAAPDLAGRVVAHGPLPQRQVGALYRAADIFTLASLRETYGTVFGEAMALGLPVVGWRTGNLPYLARDGVEGCLVSPGDVPGLALALERLARDDETRRAMGAAARRRADAWPTWAQAADLFFAAIRECVAHPAMPVAPRQVA